MASSKEYCGYILEQLRDADGVSARAMMGEYVIYCRGKVIGGIFDDRFLVKPTKSALELMPSAGYEIPYPGGKEMLLAENVEDAEFMKKLAESVSDDLPAKKPKNVRKVIM